MKEMKTTQEFMKSRESSSSISQNGSAEYSSASGSQQITRVTFFYDNVESNLDL